MKRETFIQYWQRSGLKNPDKPTTHSLHNSFFHKGSKLWNSLPTYLHNLSSHQFCSKVSDLFLTKKTNAWHLHGCNTNATAILCMLRLGHSKLNIDGRYNQICQCGAIKYLVFNPNFQGGDKCPFCPPVWYRFPQTRPAHLMKRRNVFD